MNVNDKQSYYDVLEVDIKSPPKAIHEAYMRAKNAYSSDSAALYSLMSEIECTQILEQIEEAYTILGDDNKRRLYDEAKGFISAISEEEGGIKVPPLIAQRETLTRTTPTEASIHKIVAKKRFSLDYNLNPEFEQEIEHATEFTGPLLKKIREYKNVDIIRMADMTKISKTYLLHIESENVSSLPALVYVRGFVYQYAKCLKLNPDLVATSFLYRLKKMQDQNTGT